MRLPPQFASRLAGTICVLAFPFLLCGQETPTSAQPASAATTQSGAAVSAQELANQINNPAAPVTSVQFRNILLPNVSRANGVINELQLQPVLPIGPFHSFPYVQLLKITMPIFGSTPGIASPITCTSCGSGTTGVTGIGDLQLFDLVTFKQSWGRVGVGPTVVFPTATEPQLGAGKWQAGPSFALIYTAVKNLTVGAIVQNPISFAGDQSRAHVNQMLITPTFTVNLQKGWFVGISDYNWTFNWENGNAATIPLGMQIGKIVRLGKQPFSMSIEAGGAVAKPAGSRNPGVILGFEISPIFNFHLGPHEKVKVRGKPDAPGTD